MTMRELRPVPPPAERAVREPDLSASGAREVGSIVADMWENGEKLARQEIALGLAELQVRADKLKSSLMEGAIVGAIYNAGTLVLLAAVTLGLSKLMAPWLAALLVAVATLSLGYALQMRAKKNAVESVAEEPRSLEANKERVS